MATEREIKELAYKMWEDEGCPEGKDQEHYFTAVSMLAALDNAEEEQPNFNNSPMLQDIAQATSAMQAVSVGLS